MKKINIYHPDQGHYSEQYIETRPIECPYCHKMQIPIFYNGILKDDNNCFIYAQCTNEDCKMCHVLMYNFSSRKLELIKQSSPKVREFSKTIKELSESFCSIYNDAYAAEQMNLTEITGVGYRKSLEFLIKDYLIQKYPDDKDDIKKKFLGNCIDDINSERIKEIARRATWLGNDETHYVRKWEDKDITHLKKLIELTVHWIEDEIDSERIIREMQ